MRSRLSILLLLVTCVAVVPGIGAQNRPGVPGDGQGNARAEQSFRELLAAKDHRVLHSLQAENAYVCFVRHTDRFHIVSFTPPPPAAWGKNADAEGVVDFQDYGGGIRNLRDGAPSYPLGHWTKTAYESGLTFHAASHAQAPGKDAAGWDIDVDAEEVSIQKSFGGDAGGRVTYSFLLRRSTGRFFETYQFDPRGGASAIHSEDGHCAIYRHSSLTPTRHLY